MDINIGERIKALRKERNLTQDELCNNLNKKYNTSINKGMISKWENGKEQPRLEFMINIADYFNININYLLGYAEKMYTLSSDEIRRLIYKYIPDITDLLKSICATQESLNIKLSDEFYTELALKIADEISKIDFYDAYDLFDSKIYENLDKYFKNSNAQEIFNEIKRDISNINIPKEIKIVIEEAYDDDDFYGLDLRKSILEAINDKQLTEIIVSSIYNSEIMKNISTNISKLIETSYFNTIIKEIFNENLEKLNVIGKEKVLDYIKDLLSNDKNKEGE